MGAHVEYLKKVLTHKWYVFLECCKLGIPWLGITHDLSKFSPREWRAYAINFCVEWEERPQWVEDMFSTAWNHHQKRNLHHPEYWVCMSRGTPDKVLPMPDRYRREMLADWRGAGRAYVGWDNTKEWYLNNRDSLRLHPETRAWIEEQLGI